VLIKSLKLLEKGALRETIGDLSYTLGMIEFGENIYYPGGGAEAQKIVEYELDLCSIYDRLNWD
jgi:hypothetical protein